LTEGLPVAPTAEALVVDMIYRSDTELMRAAAAAGARAFNGLGMLVHQAALSFQIWTGRPAPLDVMRSVASRTP
jgi:shikimate dehydrogenase